MGRRVPDVVRPRLRILFCGINPGLYSAAVGHHFARPGNRFWPVLHAAALTPCRFAPCEERELLACDLGITNLVARATAAADELSAAELVAGGRRLRTKVLRYQPRALAVLGIEAFRVAFAQPRARVGVQRESIGRTTVWVLPNPSGLNAHYRIEDLVALFAELRKGTELYRLRPRARV